MEYVELVNKEEFRKQVEEEILEAKDEGYDKIVDKISSDILVLNEQLKAEYEAVQECDKKIYNVTEELAKLKNTGSSEVDKLKIELSQLELSRLELSNVWSQDNDKLKNLSLDLDYHNGKIQFDDYYNKYSINHREHYELNKSNNDDESDILAHYEWNANNTYLFGLIMRIAPESSTGSFSPDVLNKEQCSIDELITKDSINSICTDHYYFILNNNKSIL